MLNIKSFFGNVGVVFCGTLVSQVVNIVALPIITSIYGTKGFGIYALILGLTFMLSPASTLKYDYGLYTTNDQVKRDKLTSLSFVLCFIFGLFLLALHYVSPGFINFLLLGDSYSLENVEMFLPLLLMSISGFQVVNSNLFVNSKFTLASIVRVVEVLFFIAFAYFMKANEDGLIFSKMISSGIIVLVFLFYFSTKINFSKIKSTFIEFKEQPFFLLPAHTLNACSREIPLIFFGYFYGIEVAGLFALSNRIIRLPITFVGQAIGDVFRTKTMDIIQSGEKLTKIYKNTILALSVMSVVILFLIHLLTEFFIVNFFDAEWSNTVSIIKTLSFIGALQLIANPLGNVFIVTKNQKLDLIWQVILFVLISISLVIGGLYYDFNTCLNLFTISYCIGYVINIIMSYRIAK